MLQIGYVEAPKGDLWKMTGGSAYRQILMQILTSRYSVEPMGGVLLGGNKIIQGTKLAVKLLTLKGKKDIWIREFASTITLPLDRTVGKNIVLIHHIDSRYTKYPALNRTFERIFYRNLHRIDMIVTVSKYWQNYFISMGHKNVGIIYNPFSVNDFDITQDQVTAFKQKYRLTGKPVVYIGNCQESKGVVETYRELNKLDVHLVTSGKQRVQIPAQNLELSYKDYLVLLKASSAVVLMSKFNEGWNRTAHEAMLCKTPVIGSGRGGMGELLEGGSQIICKDFSELREQTIHALKHPEMGVKGYEFAKNFTIEKFGVDWCRLIDGLCSNK